MKNINIRYFALLREERGVEAEDLNVNSATYTELYEKLKKDFGFSLNSKMIRVAVNDEFCRMSDEVRDGARIVFIPPVAGG
jgi:molybdopterin converting factor subunit 1